MGAYDPKIKRPADLSIVERLGGFLCCKGKTFIWIVQGFWKKNVQGECKKASLLVYLPKSRAYEGRVKLVWTMPSDAEVQQS